MQVTTGLAHTCATRGSGELYCWGLNHEGQLGNGTRDPSGSPTQVGVETDWAPVAAGGAHTCGIRAGDDLWCWGADDFSQLGDGQAESRTEPFRIWAPAQ